MKNIALRIGLSFWLMSPTWIVAQETPKESPASSGSTLFSGPQVDEALPRFEFKSGLGDSIGQLIDPVALAQGKPLVLVFLHDVNRQSISMTRVLTQYTQSRGQDGLFSAVILLAEDPTGAQDTIKRIQHALTPNVPTGVSPDGPEGPGSYGLNRAVQMTILVADKNRVKANFALVQPSLQVDLPKVVRSVVELIGGPEPKLSELLDAGGAMQNAARNPNQGDESKPDSEKIRSLVRPLIQRDAQVDQVDRAALAIERAIEESPAIKKEIGRIASTIVGSGKLDNYGTLRAQDYLKQWAQKYGKEPVRPSDDPKKP